MAIKIVKAAGLDTLCEREYPDYLKVVAVKLSREASDVDVYIDEAAWHQEVIRELVGGVVILGGCDLGIVGESLYLGGKPATYELLSQTIREVIAEKVKQIMAQKGLAVPRNTVIL